MHRDFDYEKAKIGIFPFIGKTTAQKDEKTHILFVRIWALSIETNVGLFLHKSSDFNSTVGNQTNYVGSAGKAINIDYNLIGTRVLLAYQSTISGVDFKLFDKLRNFYCQFELGRIWV